MAGPIPSESNYGSFVETTSIWDTSIIEAIPNIEEEFSEFLVQLYQNLNILSIQLNLKDTGLYPNDEFLTNKLFFPNTTETNLDVSQSQSYRSVFRKVIDFGALPNATTKSVAHGILSDVMLVSIMGTANNATFASKIPIPYSSSAALNQNISLEMTATNIVITTGTNRTSYTTCYVIVEYIKT